MKCPTCQHENPDGVQLCALCGQVVNSPAPVTSRKNALRKCWTCQYDNPEGSQFCQSCGASLDQRPCQKCGTRNALTTIFCLSCGADLNKQLEKPNIGNNILKGMGLVVVGVAVCVLGFFLVAWFMAWALTEGQKSEDERKALASCRSGYEDQMRQVENSQNRFNPEHVRTVEFRMYWMLAQYIDSCSERLDIVDDSTYYEELGTRRALLFVELYEKGDYTREKDEGLYRRYDDALRGLIGRDTGSQDDSLAEKYLETNYALRLDPQQLEKDRLANCQREVESYLEKLKRGYVTAQARSEEGPRLGEYLWDHVELSELYHCLDQADISITRSALVIEILERALGYFDELQDPELTLFKDDSVHVEGKLRPKGDGLSVEQQAVQGKSTRSGLVVIIEIMKRLETQYKLSGQDEDAASIAKRLPNVQKEYEYWVHHSYCEVEERRESCDAIK